MARRTRLIWWVSRSRHVVSTAHLLPKDGKYLLYPRNGSDKPVPMQLDPEESLASPDSVSGNELLIDEPLRHGLLLKTVDAPSGTTHAVIALPERGETLLHGQSLFVALGRDLMVVDASSGHLRKFIPDFVPGGFADNGNGLDKNAIARLYIDHDRLIAVTSYGENSQVVELAALF